MRKKILLITCAVLSAAFALNCGKSECKKYAARFCTDENSEVCKQTKERIKDWSSDQCRIAGNQIDIENQSKTLENELKEN